MIACFILVCNVNVVFGNEIIAEEWKINDEGVVEYLIKTDSIEWREFENHQQMLDACQIPEQLLESMQTKQLLKSVLNYPLIGDIYAYDSVSQGISAISKQFNGLKELLQRSDMVETLIDYYDNMQLKKETQITEKTYIILNEVWDAEANGQVVKRDEEYYEEYNKYKIELKEITTLDFIEAILLDKNNLKQMSASEIEKLSEEIEDKYQQKLSNKLYEGTASRAYKTAIENGTVEYIAETSENQVMQTTIKYITTPKGTKVEVIQYDYYGDTMSAILNARAKEDYPNAYVGSSTRIISKWGEGPLMLHGYDYCPYSGTIVYYKKNY